MKIARFVRPIATNCAAVEPQRDPRRTRHRLTTEFAATTIATPKARLRLPTSRPGMIWLKITETIATSTTFLSAQPDLLWKLDHDPDRRGDRDQVPAPEPRRIPEEADHLVGDEDVLEGVREDHEQRPGARQLEHHDADASSRGGARAVSRSRSTPVQATPPRRRRHRRRGRMAPTQAAGSGAASTAPRRPRCGRRGPARASRQALRR